MAEPRIPAPPLRGRSFLSGAGLVLALGLFAGHAALRSASLAGIERGKEGRSWEDLSLAISYAFHAEFPVAAYEVRTDFFPREDPEFVAMYWASTYGISPRAVAKALRISDIADVSRRIYRFKKRLEGNPGLRELMSPP